MQKKTANRDRLAGDGFDKTILEAVSEYNEEEWKQLDAENRAGEALNSIRTRFLAFLAERGISKNLLHRRPASPL